MDMIIQSFVLPVRRWRETLKVFLVPIIGWIGSMAISSMPPSVLVLMGTAGLILLTATWMCTALVWSYAAVAWHRHLLAGGAVSNWVNFPPGGMSYALRLFLVYVVPFALILALASILPTADHFIQELVIFFAIGLLLVTVPEWFLTLPRVALLGSGLSSASVRIIGFRHWGLAVGTLICILLFPELTRRLVLLVVGDLGWGQWWLSRAIRFLLQCMAAISFITLLSLSYGRLVHGDSWRPA